MADHLRGQDIAPDLVLCSSAERTRETLAGVGVGGETVIEPELYAATALTVLERLRRVPPETASVMVIGHNPSLQDLTLMLAHPDDRLRTLVQDKFPTGALATLAIDPEWRELDLGGARLTAFIRPRDLE